MLRGIAAALIGLYFLGFIVFVTYLPKAPENLGNIQGVVALTGGQTRIDTAYRLFRYQNVGQRMLISGVFPATSRGKMLRRLDAADRRYPVAEQTSTAGRVDLIDLGYAAENTLGNAREAAAWARFHHFHTLLIVTARYHMPRSLTEFHQALPWAAIVPYPIDPESIPKGWWYDFKTIRVLHGEYAKYLAAVLLSTLGLEPKNLDGEDRSGSLAPTG